MTDPAIPDELSKEEAIAGMAGATRLKASDWVDFLAMNEADQRELIQDYRDMHGDASKSDWDKALEIGAKCVQIAGILIPIVSAVSSVYSLVTQIKNG